MKSLLIFLFVLPVICISQNIKDTIIHAPIFTINYNLQFPGAELKKQFGVNNNIGFTAGIKNNSNWQFEIAGNFIFGNQVKDTTIIDHLQTTAGGILGLTGTYATYRIFERGYLISFDLGKLFPIIGPNPNSGLIVKMGTGVMSHKIRIENDLYQIPQLNDDKLPYYDRLTLGVTVRQYIGYQHLSNNNFSNFTVGFEITEGFMKGMRDYQIDLMESYNSYRFELLYGIKIGWIIPVYRKAPKDYYLD